MKPCHFLIDEDHPDYETEKGKWWLCENGKKYAIWRFDSKESDYKEFLIQRKLDGAIVNGGYNITDVGFKFDLLEGVA